MKEFKLVGLFLATLLVGIVAGGWFGAWWSARILSRMQFAKPELEMAFRSAQEADWAALLRLNEPQNALRDLENDLNIQLATIAAWDEVAPPDEETRKARDRFLGSAKTYQKSYPCATADAARINALLSTIPDRNPNKVCKNGVCRLDDLRIAKSKTMTSSP